MRTTQGYVDHKTPPPPLGLPSVPRQRATVGSYGGEFRLSEVPLYREVWCWSSCGVGARGQGARDLIHRARDVTKKSASMSFKPWERGEGSLRECHPGIPKVQRIYHATGFLALLILAGTQGSTHSSTRAGARGRGGLSARKLGIAPGWSRWRIASTLFLVEGSSWRSMQSARRSALSTREMQRAAQAGLVGARHGSEHGISPSLARVRAKGPGHARSKT